MLEFKLIRDKNGQITHIETQLSGNRLLSSAKLNKGCAFSYSERDEFNLNGLLPFQVETLKGQAERMYGQYLEHQTNLSKNIYLNMLHDYNETLFYKVVADHLEEMLPIIYTPTVGEAVQRFSSEHRKAKGLYICYKDKDKLDTILENRVPSHVDLTVITDGQAVLGIGDQGIGGINISIAKLMVYSLCAGVHPNVTLPIQLDVGTNNPFVLNDPMYLGWRHERITGQAYDDFIDQFVTCFTKKFPHAVIHWEDMGRENARSILERYRTKHCTLNGDIQSTGVVGLASVLAGVIASGMPLKDHRIVVLGAGAAGVGISDQIFDAMRRTGLSQEETQARFFLVDKTGLLTDRNPLLSFQEKYVKKIDQLSAWQVENKDHITLLEVVKHAKPTILIGCSTVAGAFNEHIVKMMLTYVDRPIIMPLSNPTPLSEAIPEDLLNWTQGKAIIATGSPFPKVSYNQQEYRIAQSNNALAFPGIGLGAIAVQANIISNDMLWAATQALAKCSPVNQDKMAPLLPKLSESRRVSVEVALAVAEQARLEGVAQIDANINLKEHLTKIIWEPKYYPYKKI